MKKLLFLAIFVSVSVLAADVKNLTMDQKRKMDQTLKIFMMSANRPELWTAILQDLKPYKNTKGRTAIVKFFEGRMKKDLNAYNSQFVKAAEDYQRKVYRENEKDILNHIKEAKKVFANVNKESTSKSWGHMSSVKATILPGAHAILEAYPKLRLLREQVKGMSDILGHFQDGETMKLEDFESFTVSRSITFANDEAKKIMASNEKANVPLEIKKGVRDLNVMRLIFGKNALATDEKLCACSADHSKDMKEKGFFAHESPIKGKKTPWDRARNFGTNASGENIAMGSMQAVGSNRQWYLSPGHFKNMFSSKNRVGLGQYGRYWTQMLGN